MKVSTLKRLEQAEKRMQGHSTRISKEEWALVMDRMTTEQLKELVYEDPAEERIKEIFASVGGLYLLESG